METILETTVLAAVCIELPALRKLGPIFLTCAVDFSTFGPNLLNSSLTRFKRFLKGFNELLKAFIPLIDSVDLVLLSSILVKRFESSLAVV